MKKFFRTVTALTLVCGAFAFTGCTDYEEDINSINNRLDELTTGQIASIEEQVGSLSDAIDEADGLISALQGDVDALETAKTTIEGQIKTLNDNIGTINGNISDINGKISGLETDLEKQIADAKAELEKADQANADRIDKLVSDLDQAKKDLQSEIEKGDKANADAIASLATTVSDNYSALKKAIDDANTSNKAEFDKIYGEIETLKTDLKTQTDALADLTSTVADLSGKVAALETLTAGLPELEKTVADIKENYLSKAEAADIYATAESVLKLQEDLGKVSGRLEVIEDLDIAERLSSLESNYENLTDIVIPNLNDAVVKAQSAAEKAQTSAKEAMTYAQSVFGELESLERSLEVYANDIEGRFNELSAMDAALSDRADALMEFVSDLNSTVSAEIIALRSNIASVQTILDQAVKDLESSKLDKTEFSEYFSQALMDDILKANGQVNTAINQKLAEATKNLQSSIDAVDKRIDSEVMPAINNLKERIDAVEDIVQDLANRIQSLVYVPEYSDGKATVSVYEINGKPVSEDVVVSATFKVTPAAVAEAVVNQYKDYAIAYVNDVKNPDTRAASAGTPIFGDDLKITRNASDPSYIDVEVTVPAEYNVRDERNDGFAFSLYVASKEEVNLLKEGGELLLDAGTYVSSDYVQTAVSVKELKDAYVLYNEVAGKEYPAMGEEEVEVNVFERAWSYPADARSVYFYGDNAITEDGAVADRDNGTYTLHIKLDDQYYTLDQAAEMFRVVDVNDITPEYISDYAYYSKKGIEDTDKEGYYSDYFDVNTEVEPYGTRVDMKKTSAMTDVIGSYVLVYNMFAFPEGNKYASDVAPLVVLQNTGKYTVVNEPVTVTVGDSEDNALNLKWTYGLAESLADKTDPDNWKANVQNITAANFVKEGAIPFKVENIGEINLGAIIQHQSPIADKSYVELNGQKLTENVPSLKFTDVVVDETGSAGTMNFAMTGYSFDDKQENEYHFVYVYYHEGYDVNITVDFTVTLGQMPGNATYTYPDAFEIPFMLPTEGLKHFESIEDGSNQMYDAELGDMKSQWFGDADTFAESLTSGGSKTLYTTTRDDAPLYDKVSIDENIYAALTRLNIFPADESGEPESNSFLRVSSQQVTSVDNEFGFTTEITTWYGVTYTFEATAVVEKPEYELAYIPTHIYCLDGNDPYVQLDYEASADGKWVINAANPNSYFEVHNIPDDFTGVLKVKFETLTVSDPAAGYDSVPQLETLNVNNATGALGEYTIDWTAYTGRDLKIKATLVASSAEGASEITINDLDLTIQVYPLITGFETKTAEDKDFFGNQIVTEVKDDAEYIVINRTDNKDLVINLWEYLNAYSRFSNGENFIPYTDPSSGNRHTKVGNVNANRGMKIYGAELVFDTDYISLSNDDFRRLPGYDAQNGTLTYYAEDGEIANPIYFEVKATINYYLDYNGKVGEILSGSIISDLNQEMSPVIGAREVTLRIKLQDK